VETVLNKNNNAYSCGTRKRAFHFHSLGVAAARHVWPAAAAAVLLPPPLLVLLCIGNLMIKN